MAETSAIEWTDATWNPILGCTLESPGCRDCYAMQLAGTRLKNHPSRKGLTRMTKTGPVWTGEVRFWEPWAVQPLHWRRPRRIFVCAHADLFHPDVPDEWIDRILAVIALAGHHTFQILTKRSARMLAYFSDPDWRRRVLLWVQKLKPSSLWNGSAYQAGHELDTNGVLPNLWLGVSIEDATRQHERTHDLAQTPAAYRYFSCEPLLGPLDLFAELGLPPVMSPPWVDLVIVGGESGDHRARPMHPAWARSIRDQCAAAGVAFMFKQRGAWTWREADDGQDWAPQRRLDISGKLLPLDSPRCRPDEIDVRWVGKGKAGRLLDGQIHDGLPLAA